ncbi:MAG TPA: hypothetical protein VFS25_17125 [Chitinophaga sp.]|uniref:hypothetical protein n=1 Tax=Chitinophaga sp. TaxID=1869181 RepID=UPI002DBA3339|nr:hypothetical protein [Chitinophaga sp.]HEU4554571.1 hypothetical protein [Chitinophaga sp.]
MDTLARRLETYSGDAVRTTLYVRTSKDIYERMEDLWFKAYALDAQHQLLSGIDQTLYIQLVYAQKDSVVWEEAYPIENGIANGHIYLNDSLPEGNYWLCAYSAHSLTRDAASFTGVRSISIVRNVAELLRKKPAGRRTDSLQKKIQLHLLPESGVLLSGVTNRVAFKAVAENGLPCTVSGTLFDGNTAIGHFKSSHAGTGSFLLRPAAGSTYHVRLDAPFADTLYPLPAASTQGMTFRLLHNSKDSILFRVYNQAPEKQLFYFRLQTRGLTQLMASATIQDSLDLKLPLQNVTAGVAEATLFDHGAVPVAERLVYVKPDHRLSVTATLSRKSYGTKTKIVLHIHTTDEQDKPVIAQLGAAAYDRIYHRPADPNDIQTHYLLTTQLKGRIYDPGYYFDTTQTNRLQALDLLLLTQGWRSYSWNEEELKKTGGSNSLVLSDSTRGELVTLRKKTKSSQQAVMLFDAEQQHNQLVTLDNQGTFRLSPEHLKLSRNIYIKHYGEQRDFELKVHDPFEPIHKIKPWQKINYPLESIPMASRQVTAEDLSILTRGSIQLKAVEVQGKTAVVFRDKYIGHLDSLAKYRHLTDKTHGGWLNCPAGDGDERPVEGQTYIVWTGPNPPASHPFSFNSTNTKQIVYHYPRYTEEALLKMFGIAKAKGYYPRKEFYQPNYDQQQNAGVDYRNTLLWAPDIITDENGDATVEFFSSDINTAFYGIVEGVSGNGLAGKTDFEFTVTK